jgi:hypothetical protein
MAINKITPRALDKSTDYKLVPSTAFIDAVNVVLSEDESSGSGDSGGDNGVIKNVKGNSPISFHRADDAIAPGEYKVIGTTVDRKLKLVFIYVFHENAAESGVWVYDKEGVLSLPTKLGIYQGLISDDPFAKNKLKCVVKGSFFHFDQNSVVQGNIVYGNAQNIPTQVYESIIGEAGFVSVTASERDVFEKNIHLYFTDNVNEPKKIDVTASLFSRVIMLNASNPRGRFASSNGGWFAFPDPAIPKSVELYSHACRPVPLQRPTFTWDRDEGNNTNNFEYSEGFKFAYQLVFNDGSVSTISPKSELAVLPSLLFQGKRSRPDHERFNICRISIKSELLQGFTNPPPYPVNRIFYVKKVKILAQEGAGPYKIIKETDIDNNEVLADNSIKITFDFKNDVIAIPVSEKEENKYFDGVPQKAEAQSVVDNRLMYGNYVEGYPTPVVDATLSVIYGETLSENLGSEIKITNSISREKDPQSNYSTDGYDVLQQMSGFRIEIEDGDFPFISTGDFLELRMSFRPNQNFHLYNASDSYHQSLSIGKIDAAETPIQNLTILNPREAGGSRVVPPIAGAGITGEFAKQNVTEGSTASYDRSFHAFKPNGGVASLNWTTHDYHPDWSPNQNPTQNAQEVYVGTSAANPFIIPGNEISYKIRLRCLIAADPDTLREKFFEILDRIMDVGGSGIDPYDTSPNENWAYVPDESNIYAEYEWDIDSITNLKRFNEGDPETKLISMVTNEPNYSGGGGPDGMRCRGAVVAKKGKAVFGLRRTDHLYGLAISQYNSNRARDYKVFLDSIPTEGLELWTFVRKWLPGSNWFALQPGYLSSPSQRQTFYDTSTSYTFQLPGVRNSSDPAGCYPRFKDTPVGSGAFEQPGDKLFAQYNDARDFNVPSGEIVMADIAIDDENPFGIVPQYVFADILYNLGLNGENEKIHEATNTFLGHGVPNNEIDGQYFICSARPRQNIENNTFLNNTDGKLYSLMDGEGGPGGDGPVERFSGTSYFVQDNFPVYGAVPESGQINIPYARSPQLALEQGNPVINATKRASTAFGLVAYPSLKNYVRNPNSPSTYGQYHLESTPRIGGTIQQVSDDGEFGTGDIDFPGIISTGGTIGSQNLSFSVNYAGPVWFGPWFTGKILHNTALHLIQSEVGADDIYIDDSNFDLDELNQLDDLSNFTDQRFFVIDPSYRFQSRVEHGGGPFGGPNAGAFGGRSTLPYLQGPPKGLVGKELSNSFLNQGNDYSATTQIVSMHDVFSYIGQEEGDESWDDSIVAMDFLNNASEIEFTSIPTFEIDFGGGEGQFNPYRRSFKSSCDHEFGIQFYDKLGRRSFVSPLGSVHVNGFSDEERENKKGLASVKIEMFDDPPQWADKYQIVYGGNKSIVDFIQYSTNNAFLNAKSFEENPALAAEGIATTIGETGAIYVSLNLLQQSEISYSKEFGAVGEDNSFNIYKFQKGDKIRILSYGPDGERIYPQNAIFNIINIITLDPNSALLNPLISLLDEEEQNNSKYYGDFLIIQDNEDVEGFAFSEFVNGNQKWDQNVVFEAYSPLRTTGIEVQTYHEIGDVYPLAEDNLGNKAYSVNPVEVYEGDVFMRPIALNVNPTNISGDFVDLMSVDSNATDLVNDLSSNFVNNILESSRPTDLFPSKMKLIGRPNIENSEAKTVRRESGITYSEKSSPDSTKLNYSSFNAFVFPYKDLEERFGNINFMDEIGGNLFVIQQDRCTLVPVSATILTNATGQEQLIASNDILGKENVYSVTAGCDNNPESVVRVDTVYYFAHKSLGKVFRFTQGQGIEEISDVNMGAYLRAKFKEAIEASEDINYRDIRVPGGFDPVKQEYLMTILPPKVLPISNTGTEVSIPGCTDPESINYNPNATVNDGSCQYEEVGEEQKRIVTVQVESLDGNVLATFDNDEQPLYAFDTTESFLVGQTSIVARLRIKNIGNIPAYPSEMAVPGAYGNLTIVYPEGGYALSPDEEAVYDIMFEATSQSTNPDAFADTLMLSLNPDWDGEGVRLFRFRLRAPIVQGYEGGVIGEDVGNQKTGVSVNFYIGGTLVGQQFAQNNNGVWTVSVDTDGMIESINNSYTRDGMDIKSGSKALLEVELEFDSSVEDGLSDSDRIRITGEIMNSLEGFKFTST